MTITLSTAFYGVIFPGQSEAAFSNYRLWESVGFIITFASSTTLCINEKIIIVLVFISIGFVGYIIIEVIQWRGGLKKDTLGNVVTIDKLVTGNY